MATLDYFIPERAPATFYPFGNYLRAMPVSVAAQYIGALTRPGDLILDPFGATPNVARAALALNRRAIVIDSHPLYAWLARAMATLPSLEIDAALARLGDAPKDDAPIRAHIAQLYNTLCAACGKLTPVDYFVIGRDVGPVRRHYTCAHCGVTRDDPATDDDRQRAASFDAHGLHYHVAFERVVPEGNLHAERIRKLLDVYTPRNLYALVTLTQKIDSLFHATRERNILLLLLLHLLDRATSFYTAPANPPQIIAHKQCIEFNLWRGIEITARELSKSESIAITNSMEDLFASDAPSAFIGRGNLQTIAREIPKRSVALVLTAQPTRRLALLALSYFGGAWILGRAAMQTLTPFLDAPKDLSSEIRRYAELLDQTMPAMAELMRGDGRSVFVFDESKSWAIESVMMAGALAHLKLESFLFQPRLGESPRAEFGDLRGSYRIAFSKVIDESQGETTERELPSDDARVIWRPVARPARVVARVEVGQVEQKIRGAALDAGRKILTRRGEPLAFSWLHHAAFERIARDGLLEQIQFAESKTPPGKVAHDAVIAGLREGYAHDFDHIASATQFLWRRQAPLDAPLIDRVDDAVHEFLARGEIPFVELEETICRQFPGDLTPEAGLIELCAAAAESDAGEKVRALEILTKLGEKLGYAVIASEDDPHPVPPPFASRTGEGDAQSLFDLVWQSDGELAHGFIWRERAQFTDLIDIQVAPACGYVIVPEKAVGLMQEKVRRLPFLADAFHESGWHFVRAPFVEKLLAQDKIERDDLALVTGLEPRLGKGTQMEMFGNV